MLNGKGRRQYIKVIILCVCLACNTVVAGTSMENLQLWMDESKKWPTSFSPNTGHRYWDISRNDTCSIEIKSSSVLSPEYKALNAFDMLLETAWVEGKPDEGIGEWVSVKITQNGNTVVRIIQIAVVGALVLQNYRNQNNRVKKMEIVFDYGNGRQRNDIIEFPDELSVVCTTPYSYDKSSLSIELTKGTSIEIRFIIKEVYPGSKWNDTCIPMIYISGSEMGW
jgi:hypothetical protein